MEITYAWRADLADAQLVALTEAHGGNAEPGWWDRARQHSLGWVSAHDGDQLVGFANLAWDDAGHAFLLDPKVHADWQRRGIGTELVRRARDAARDAGCEWLHVDFEPHLRPFYFDACGFTSTDAGLIRLTAS
ncbi:GNAT family N-acetyltransferase [Amycolatopsis sp. A1MSW2902]|uniref:GNAT family N-acetyltransferase n=1 Tax=Amycolatopsis sp. A1MSW2902 TaxID=687413 RepID=UPI00307ECEC0